MPKQSQFQNLVLQQTLRNVTRHSTNVQPAIALPIKQAPISLSPAAPFFSQPLPVELTTEAAQETIEAIPTVSTTCAPALPEEDLLPGVPRSSKKKQLLRGVALLLSALIVLAIYLTWHATTPTDASPVVTQPAYSGSSNTVSPQSDESATPSIDDASGAIQVYIVGAIKHPGVYTLPGDARVYQLIQAAGGTQPDANLVSINLAAKLTDGQEIYVLSLGETPPAYTNNSLGSSVNGTPVASGAASVNLNTATETQMEQVLHVSATTAKKIITYRTQHGTYTSVDQLLQVISQSIYDRIKNLVTV